MRKHLPLISVLVFQFFAFSGLVWWHGETVRQETERSLFDQVHHEHVVRAKTDCQFLGYQPEEERAIRQVAKDYHLMPAFLAAIGRHENGAMMFRPGISAECPITIKKYYGDPRCWPWAQLAQLITTNWIRYDQRPEEFSDHIISLAKQYNHNWKDWATNVALCTSSYSAGESLTRNQRAGKPGHKAPNRRTGI